MRVQPAQNMRAEQPSSSRVIAPSAWAAQRWDWLRAVLGDDQLGAQAKVVATALVHCFANSETGQCNPGYAAIAAQIGGPSTDTVKRAVGQLLAGGWVIRASIGQGRGHASGYRFASRGYVVALHSGGSNPLSSEIKGGKSAPTKGGKSAPCDKIKGGKSASEKGANLPPITKEKNQMGAHPRAYARGGLSDAVLIWAAKIEAGQAVPSNIFTEDQIRDILDLELLTKAQFRGAGIEC